MEEKIPQGTLFGSVAYYDNKQLHDVIENMSFEQAYFYITQALQYSFVSGDYNLQESEILSKSLRILSNHLSENK
jgi:hypothetical protein